MASLQQVNEALKQVVAFLTPLVPLIQCHMVDFLTLRHWDTLLPPSIQKDLLSLPSDALHLLPTAALPHTHNNTAQGNQEPWSFSSSGLSSFLSQVHRHCPAALGMTIPIDQILGEFGSAEISILAMRGIMSHKKTHEVDTMAQVIARLAKGLDVQWLVDLGSGRGYLSTSLVLQYSQNVVAIDSSTANTTSAIIRNAKLKRQWDNLRQVRLDREEGRSVKKGKKARRKKTPTNPQQQQEQEQKQAWRQENREEEHRKWEDRKQESINQEERKQGSINQEDRKEEHRRQEERKQDSIDQENRKQEHITQKDRKQENISQEKEKQEETRSKKDRKQEESRQNHKTEEDIPSQDRVSNESHAAPHSGCYIGVTKFITEDTDLLEVVRNSIRSEKVTEEDRSTDESDTAKNDSRLDLKEEIEDCTSSDVISISTTHITTTPRNTDARKHPADREKETDIYSSSHVTSTTHTNTTNRITNTKKQPPFTENSDHHTSPSTTSNDATLTNTLTSNTSTKSPPPPLSTHQEYTSTCMVDETSSLGLIGLHTCGNLASSSLRLFKANPRVAFLCNVGCCYHLLEEEFSQNTYNQQKTPHDTSKPSILSKKGEECVPRCEEEKEILTAIRQENNASKSTTSHTEQVGKPIRLLHKEESVPKCEEEKEIVVSIEGESESLKSRTGHNEQEERPTRLTLSEEEEEKEDALRREEAKKVLAATRQEDGALKTSAGHKEPNKCRESLLAYLEETAKEHEGTEQSNTKAKKDCIFSASSINHTDEREINCITETKQFTEGPTSSTGVKKKTHNISNSPLQPRTSSPPLLQGHPSHATEESHNPDPTHPSQPLKDHAVITREKEEGHSHHSPVLPSFSSPLQGHSSPDAEGRLYRNNPSPLITSPPPLPRMQEEGREGDIDPLHPSRIPNLGHGFPLSTFLRDKSFSLGRNSRMLSSQAADRLTRGNVGGGDSLYWRALLQVVLVDKLGDVSHLSHVGRLSAKCHTFPEYAREALARLGVSLEITEEDLQEYDRRHSSCKGRLERFFLLRASLAAVVEGAVLLDRLAFLCEQDDVLAFLVPLFDPVTSPRSHALIAIRQRERERYSHCHTQSGEGMRNEESHSRPIHSVQTNFTDTKSSSTQA